MELVKHVGSPTATGTLVHVEDRGADRFPFFRICLSAQTHVAVRAAENRRVEAEEERGHLLDLLRPWPSQDHRPCEVPASHERQSRETTPKMSFGQVIILSHAMIHAGAKNRLLCGWRVRGKKHQREKRL
jgi:hypothetical protein